MNALQTGAAAGAAVLAVALVWGLVRGFRALPYPAPALAAAICTAYSGDTAWRFAGDHLGMADTTERAALFAAGEVALLALALTARHTMLATGSAGVPGVLVWVVTGVQLVPAFAEGGTIGGLVRGFFGPVLAALLWHLALGLEIRRERPDAASSGLLAVVGREVRERALSRLGLAVRGRDAAQLTRDRATATAVRLASRRWRGPWANRRLAAAVARSGVATDSGQRAVLLAELTARRTAGALASVPVSAPWDVPAVPGTPSTPEYGAPEAVPAVPGTRPDPLTARVRREYADGYPSVRELKARYSIGQARAQRIREGLAMAG
ncbi:hypothetical protein [Streptomyces sp. NPDC050560]|uniref:hypothetical protein n=1 Tax=Streptomyces sp. NPDC050560 TaxID=3365630 RepID=UPI0037A5F0AF